MGVHGSSCQKNPFSIVIIYKTMVSISKKHIKEVICLHGVPTIIMSDKDTKFMKIIYKPCMKTLGHD